MKPIPSRNPTPAELAILNVLWQRGPSTVRQIHGRLDRSTGYTTVLKTLQLMSKKGLVSRDETAPAHVYRAGHPEEQIQRQLVGDLMDRAFGGSAAKLVQQALSSKPARASELEEIRDLLRKLEEGAHDG